VIACMEMRLRPARRAGPTTDTRRQTHSGVGVGVVASCRVLQMQHLVGFTPGKPRVGVCCGQQIPHSVIRCI
jgi:hypothetical protein